MTAPETHLVALTIAAGLNVPFGVYRATVRRLSWRWLLAIHLPVPAVAVARVTLGLAWWSVAILVAAAVAGQLLGSWLYSSRLVGRRGSTTL